MDRSPLWTRVEVEVGVGVRNKERRAAKAKDRQRRAQERAARGPLDDDPFDLGHVTRNRWIQDTFIAALSAVDLDRPGSASVHIRALADATRRPDFAPLIDTILVAIVDDQVCHLWKRGWQPADVVRALRRTVKAGEL